MSTSPHKEASPPTVTFTEKEDIILKVAWQCLKTGPPDIDMVKLTKLGKFNTNKTATNTWGVIKKKLAQMTPQLDGEDAVGGASPIPKTPRSKATPKKRGKKAGSEGDGDEVGAGDDESPPKRQRKTPTKKAPKKVKEEVKEEEEEEAMFEDPAIAATVEDAAEGEAETGAMA